MQHSKAVDEYIDGAEMWQSELRRLRKILQSTGLNEDVKWGGPCYTHKGKNVVGIGAFKSYFGLWFHQGALLDDDAGVLVNAQQGKTRAQRQWRMHHAADIKPAIIRRYVKQAVGHIDAGRRIKADRSRPVNVPPELSQALCRERGATAAFGALQKGQQREYADYIAEARRDETKRRRVAKILPMILAGGGLNDRYR